MVSLNLLLCACVSRYPGYESWNLIFLGSPMLNINRNCYTTISRNYSDLKCCLLVNVDRLMHAIIFLLSFLVFPFFFQYFIHTYTAGTKWKFSESESQKFRLTELVSETQSHEASLFVVFFLLLFYSIVESNKCCVIS